MVTKYQVKDALRTNKHKVEAELKRIQTFIAQPGLVISEETLKFIQDEIKAMQDYSKALGNLIVDINTSDFKESTAPAVIPIESMEFDKATYNAKVGDKIQTNMNLVPINTTEAGKITYSSENEESVTIDSKGEITVVKYVETPAHQGIRVIATAPGGIEATAAVVVEDDTPKEGTVMVKYQDESGVDVAQPEPHTGIVGEDYAFEAKAISGYTLKTDAANKAGKYTEDPIEVKFIYSKDPIHVTSVDLTPETATVKIGETTQLKATVWPDNADNKEVVFTSSDEAIATVSETGLVTAVAEGEADITVTTKEGGFTKSAKITVPAAVAAE